MNTEVLSDFTWIQYAGFFPYVSKLPQPPDVEKFHSPSMVLLMYPFDSSGRAYMTIGKSLSKVIVPS
jgi:hypothetical protein